MTQKANQSFQAIIIGAGAAGLFCAVKLGQRGIKTLLIEHNERAGKKILISGGGRCNFTNTGASSQNYLSENPHFFKSALSRYSPADFLALIKKYNIPYFEKKKGQLFCKTSSKEILQMLLAEISNSHVSQVYNCHISSVAQQNTGFKIQSNQGVFTTKSLVVAAGGLSFSQLGASDYGYQLARQFGLNLVNPQPALVPFECDRQFKKTFGTLSGLSFTAKVSLKNVSFTDDVLITHTGLSGPAILQISNYWNSGDEISLNLLPDNDTFLLNAKKKGLKQTLTNYLSQFWPERFVNCFLSSHGIDSKPVNELADKTISQLMQYLSQWKIKPIGTLGYSKAEVTRGGVNTNDLSSQSLEAKKVQGLYFIGEVVDVTGWLGGYNFQWAWASASAAAQNIASEK